MTGKVYCGQTVLFTQNIEDSFEAKKAGTMFVDLTAVYIQTWRLKLSNMKTVTTTFHLNNKEANCELNVYNNGNLLPPCPVPKYLGVSWIGYSLFVITSRLCKKLSTQVVWLRQLLGSGWGAGTKTLCISALSLIYSTAEYCTPIWCRSVHTCLIDSILNDSLHIAIGCLCPTPAEDLPVLTGIQPAELCQLKAILSLANCAIHDPDHVLHRQLIGQQDVHQGRLRSRRPFTPAEWKLIGSFSKLDKCVKQ